MINTFTTDNQLTHSKIFYIWSTTKDIYKVITTHLCRHIELDYFFFKETQIKCFKLLTENSNSHWFNIPIISKGEHTFKGNLRFSVVWEGLDLSIVCLMNPTQIFNLLKSSTGRRELQRSHLQINKKEYIYTRVKTICHHHQRYLWLTSRFS